MRVELKIDTITLDLLDGTDGLFYVNAKIFDLRDLQSRAGSYTREFEIPATGKNTQALGLDSNEKLSNPSYPCQIIVDGIPFAQSELIILDYTEYTINITLVDGNFSFIDRIKDESIRTIEALDFEFTWTTAGLAAIAANTDGSVILDATFLDEFYFIENQTDNRYIAPHNIKTWGFFFYCKTLFQIIAEEAGFTLDDSALTNDNIYQNSVLACPVDAFLRQSQVTTYFAEWTYLVNQEIISDGRLQFTSLVQDANTLYDTINHEYVCPADGEYVITLDYDIDVLRGNASSWVEIFIFANGTTVIDSQQYSLDGPHSGTLSGTLIQQAGDLLSADILTRRTDDITTVFSTTSFTYKSAASIQDDPINVSDYFPDVSRKAFIKSFLPLFFGLFEVDIVQKIIRLFPFSDLEQGTPKDLTNNLDTRTKPSNAISIASYGQESLLTYSTDSTVNRTDTNFKVFFVDSQLQVNATIINIIFSDSDRTQLIDGVNCITMPFFTADFTDGTAVSYTVGTGTFQFTAAEAPPKFKPGDYIHTPEGTYRIRQKTGILTGTIFDNFTATAANVQYKIIEIDFQNLTPRIGLRETTGDRTGFIQDNGWNQGPGASVPNFKRCDFDALRMENIHNTYYDNIFTSLQTPKIIECWMVFTSLEIYEIELSKPVTVQGFNGKYMINFIEQWKLNQPCRVELIRINSII